MLEEYPSANSLSDEFLKTTDETRHVTSNITMTTMPLSAVLEEHFPEGRTLDLLNVDVEGLDYEVLESNDWDTYRPKVVVIELMADDLFDLQNDPSTVLLKNLRYRALGRSYVRNNVGSLFFVDQS